MSAASIRARVRAEMTDEIKAVARRHLAEDGANLSLRAVARDVGMVSSAVYRYFASRDELLTALIIDAYNALGEAAEAVAGSGPFTGRYLAVGHAVRDWALAGPHEWALIYGSPVPGYQAPRDTVGPATRVIILIGQLVRDAYAAGETAHADRPPQPLATELATIGTTVRLDVPPALVARAMSAWIHLCGAVSAELFGQLNNTIDDRRAFFELQLRDQAALIVRG
ncbi:TetR/AcrR family transcriptional regulator [Actinoplanes sp. NPDC051633]|uniref:TetR/AcrR family transcriptional regulator n=1 Tax=Actinoplanes sp. NPDC051633 TaxID=3155670 RepID=UPI003426D192